MKQPQKQPMPRNETVTGKTGRNGKTQKDVNNKESGKYNADSQSLNL
jgi:hypothetical protein